MANPVGVSTPSDLEVQVIREFNAPRELVFEAWTNPDLLRRWHTGNGASLTTCDVDLRVGGSYRFVWTMAHGEMGMSGEYLEVEPPTRLVSTMNHNQPWYAGSTVSTMVLTESAGGTKVVLTLRFDSREARDVVIATAWAANYAAGFDALDELLAAQIV